MKREITQDNTEYLFQFVKDSHAIKSLEDLNKKFGEVVRQFGYESFICIELVGFHEHTKPSKLFGNWNKLWDKHYFHKQYFRYDDCLRFLPSSNQAYNWDTVKNSNSSTSIGLRIMEEAKDFKGHAGLLVPIKSFDGRFSLVSLMGEHVDESEEARITLEIAAMYFSEIGARLVKIKDVGTLTKRLTPRQVEILKWLSLGKRTYDIADILNISIKTIDRHLEDARARLNVITTHQLLVNAVMKGEIIL